MGQLLKSSKKCMHYDDHPTFSHGMRDNSISNQNPDDFGFLYFLKIGKIGTTKTLKGTCIYDFDKFSSYRGYDVDYLCDERGTQYSFGIGEPYKSYGSYGSYKLLDSEKLIHDDDFSYCYTHKTVSKNDYGNWSYGKRYGGTYGGGIFITYTPSLSTHDIIYVYLTNGPLRTNYFTLYDMTDPDVLSGTATGHYSGAASNNILHVYDMGDCYNYLSDGGFVDIAILFNKIGKHSTSNKYSIFYGYSTWIYIYSLAGNFRGKIASVKKYNYDNQSTPIQTSYVFDHTDNNIGYNIIGLPMFDLDPNKAYMPNYYDITIS